MKRLLLCGAAALMMILWTAPNAQADEPTGTIIVTAIGFKSTKGDAIVAIYKDGKHWLKISKSYRKQVVPMTKMKDGTMRFKLRRVPYGEYAVTVLHDKNRNGTLDMRWFPWPKPKEHGGVSNNWVRKGKPTYSKAKFDLNRRIMSLRIFMRR